MPSLLSSDNTKQAEHARQPPTPHDSLDLAFNTAYRKKRGREINKIKITGNRRKNETIKQNQKEEKTKDNHVRTSCTSLVALGVRSCSTSYKSGPGASQCKTAAETRRGIPTGKNNTYLIHHGTRLELPMLSSYALHHVNFTS